MSRALLTIGIAGVHPPDVGWPLLQNSTMDSMNSFKRLRVSTRFILGLHRGKALLIAVAQKSALLAHRVYVFLLRVYGQRLFHQTPHGVQVHIRQGEGAETHQLIRLLRSMNLKLLVVTTIGELVIVRNNALFNTHAW